MLPGTRKAFHIDKGLVLEEQIILNMYTHNNRTWKTWDKSQQN